MIRGYDGETGMIDAAPQTIHVKATRIGTTSIAQYVNASDNPVTNGDKPNFANNHTSNAPRSDNSACYAARNYHNA